MILLFEILPFSICLIWVLYSITKIFLKIYEIKKEFHIDEAIMKYIHNIIAYPIILVVCWFPIELIRINQLIYEQDNQDNVNNL